jgi:hypothetical protein
MHDAMDIMQEKTSRHQHLRVTQDGVVEEDAEEHEAQGHDLLPGDVLDAQEAPVR